MPAEAECGVKTPAQLDREIAESYLGMLVTADSSGIPSRRVAGIATKVDTSAAGTVMLWLAMPDGSLQHVFLGNVVPELPQATLRRRRGSR